MTQKMKKRKKRIFWFRYTSEEGTRTILRLRTVEKTRKSKEYIGGNAEINITKMRILR